MNKVESEEQRQALLQVVEYHRELVKNTNKSSLKLPGLRARAEALTSNE